MQILELFRYLTNRIASTNPVRLSLARFFYPSPLSKLSTSEIPPVPSVNRKLYSPICWWCWHLVTLHATRAMDTFVFECIWGKNFFKKQLICYNATARYLHPTYRAQCFCNNNFVLVWFTLALLGGTTYRACQGLYFCVYGFGNPA